MGTPLGISHWSRTGRVAVRAGFGRTGLAFHVSSHDQIVPLGSQGPRAAVLDRQAGCFRARYRGKNERGVRPGSQGWGNSAERLLRQGARSGPGFYPVVGSALPPDSPPPFAIGQSPSTSAATCSAVPFGALRLTPGRSPRICKRPPQRPRERVGSGLSGGPCSTPCRTTWRRARAGAPR